MVNKDRRVRKEVGSGGGGACINLTLDWFKYTDQGVLLNNPFTGHTKL